MCILHRQHCSPLETSNHLSYSQRCGSATTGPRMLNCSYHQRFDLQYKHLAHDAAGCKNPMSRLRLGPSAYRHVTIQNRHTSAIRGLAIHTCRDSRPSLRTLLRSCTSPRAGGSLAGWRLFQAGHLLQHTCSETLSSLQKHFGQRSGRNANPFRLQRSLPH